MFNCGDTERIVKCVEKCYFHDSVNFLFDALSYDSFPKMLSFYYDGNYIGSMDLGKYCLKISSDGVAYHYESVKRVILD